MGYPIWYTDILLDQLLSRHDFIETTTGTDQAMYRKWLRLNFNSRVNQILKTLTVVSILEVMIRLGERLFQSKDVSGAVCSGDFELESNARGVSF